MNRTLKVLLGVVLAAGLLGLLTFAFLEGRAEVSIPRQSRGPYFVSRSKRLCGAANAATGWV